jgi:DNA-binding beta-propeller fold protein YncE
MVASTVSIGRAFLLAGCLATATAAAQQSATVPGAQRLLILSKNERMLSIVDPATLKIVGRIPAGPDPHEVVASTDGKRAYISNYGGGTYNTLTIVDLANQKSLGTLDLGALRGPHGLDFKGGRVWFTSEVAKVVGSYDPATSRIDRVIGTGQNGTHMVYASPDGSRLVTTNVGSGSVSIIEIKGGQRPDWDVVTVPAGGRVEGMDVSPDGKQVWAANAQDGTITIIDLASKRATSLAANVRGANRLKFTPDGEMVLVSTLGGPDLTIIRASDRTEVKRIPVGRGAAGIQIQPDGLRAYIACSPDDYVAVVDLRSFQVIGRIDAGKTPDGLAWAITQP